MRYFTAGAPIEDLQGNFLFGIKPKIATTEELKNLSFYSQDSIKIFTSFDQANESYVAEDHFRRHRE